MAPLPGKPLFYVTLYHDAAESTGVTMHPHRHFTEKHQSEYHPLSDMFDEHTKQRVIQAHRSLIYLFQPVPTHSVLHWSWRLISTVDTASPWFGSTRWIQFECSGTSPSSLDTHTAQRLIHHSLVHRILPQVTKDHTKVPIPKEGDLFSSRV